MEAIGAAASVMTIVEIVGKVSASATSFMRDIKDARKDMIEVRKDMADLSTILKVIAEDLDDHSQDDSAQPDDTMHGQQHTVDIAHSCGAVLLEIETALRDGRSRLAWVMSGKKRMDGLRARLETCKLSLDVALDYRTMVVVHDIKVDSTRIVGDVSSIQRDVALLLNKVDNIERTAWGGQESPYDTAFPGGVMLDRFLNECRSDAQSVLDTIDYQQDQEFEDARRQVGAETPRLNLESRTEVTSSSPLPMILFRNSLGHESQMPLEQRRSWAVRERRDPATQGCLVLSGKACKVEQMRQHMEEIIKYSYLPDSAYAEEIKNGRYTLYHEGQAIPPAKWADCINPGSSVDLKLWNDETIKFKDAVGRKFSFPFHLINTWKGFEDMVNQAFAHVEVIEPRVEEGHYDLIGPDGEIILPVLWEQVIRPGMQISMEMWRAMEPHKQATAETEEFQPQHMARPVGPTPIQERLPQSLVANGSPSQSTGSLDSEKSRQMQHTRPSSRQHNNLRFHPTLRRLLGKDKPMRPTGFPGSQPLQAQATPGTPGSD